MTKKLISLSLLALSAIFLTGCVHTGLYPAKPSPTATPVVQSTGDADKDLQAIDKEMEQDTDIPDVTNSDLGL